MQKRSIEKTEKVKEKVIGEEEKGEVEVIVVKVAVAVAVVVEKVMRAGEEK